MEYNEKQVNVPLSEYLELIKYKEIVNAKSDVFGYWNGRYWSTLTLLSKDEVVESLKKTLTESNNRTAKFEKLSQELQDELTSEKSKHNTTRTIYFVTFILFVISLVLTLTN